MDLIRAAGSADASVPHRLALATSIIASAPRSPVARVLLWREAAAAGDEAAAALAREAVLRLTGDDPARLTALGHDALRVGAFAEAEELFALAGGRAPDPYATLLARSALRLEAGDRNAAAALLRDSARLAPIEPPSRPDGPLILCARSMDAVRYEVSFAHDRGFHGVFRGGQLPFGLLLDARDHRAAVANLLDDAAPLESGPEPALLVNAIACPERGCAALGALAAFATARPGLPVINRPEAVLRTRPENIARLAAGVPGVHLPGFARYSRTDDINTLADEIERDFPYSILIGLPGDRLHLAENRGALLDRLAAVASGSELLVRSFHDTRDASGLFRKGRAVLIDGRLHPFALLGGEHWRVRAYDRSSTESEASLTAEDQAFIADPSRAIGSRRWSALRALCAATRLDYVGVDFVATADGILILDVSPAIGPLDRSLAQPFTAMIKRHLSQRRSLA